MNDMFLFERLSVGNLTIRQMYEKHGKHAETHACSTCTYLKRNSKRETVAVCVKYPYKRMNEFRGHWEACGLWDEKQKVVKE